MTNTRKPDFAFAGTAALLFAASAAVTATGCGSMSSMPGMEMPGGWTMSMTWMRMPGQSWSGAAAMFIGMWTVMMIAMMLPSLTPMLVRYRRAIGRPDGYLTTLVGAGYFIVWALCGAAVFPVGLALAEIAMRSPAMSRAAPVATGLIVVAAGLLQFTQWKARQLACCRAVPAQRLTPDASTAWRHGLRLGFLCVRCCAGLTAVLLAIGVMDLRAMALVTAAITAERWAPASAYAARAIGILSVAAGLWLIVGRSLVA